MTPPDRPGTDVHHYFAVLGRRKWIVILAVLVAATTALVASVVQTPIYESHARVLIEPTQSLFQTEVNSVILPSQIETEIQVIQGETVRDAVRQQLGVAPKIAASAVGTTAVIDIAAANAEPAAASRVANAYAESYVEYRRKRVIDSLVAATKELQGKVAELDRQIAEVDARELAANPPDPDRPRAALTPEQESLRDQRSAFKEKLDQVQVDTALKDGGAQLVSRARVPTDPVRPTTVRNVLLGLLVGLLVGTGLAFLFDQLDDSLKTKDDFQRVAGGLPVVGVIPKMVGWRNRTEPRLFSLMDPNSPAAEAYRTLRTSIQFIGVDRSIASLQVTSPTSADGKTTTVANLAVALALAGQRVTVISCDLRRPRVHEFFDLSNSVGFTSVLVGDASLASALQDVEGNFQLRLLASGPVPPNPSELLASHRTAQVISALTAQSDVVLIDCPPVLPVTDAAVLSAHVDGTLLVTAAGTTTGKQLHRAVELLHQVDAPLVGLVMNGADPNDAYGYGYGYYRYEDRLTKETGADETRRQANGRRGLKGRAPAKKVPAKPSSS